MLGVYERKFHLMLKLRELYGSQCLGGLERLGCPNSLARNLEFAPVPKWGHIFEELLFAHQFRLLPRALSRLVEYVCPKY